MRRVLRYGLVALLAIAVLAVGGFLWFGRPQTLLPEATAALASTAEVTFEEDADGRLVYRPAGGSRDVGLVLYPGGRVPAEGYAPQAQAIAAEGYLVVIVPVPFNFAVFDIGAAAGAIAAHPEVSSWAVGGHSLGGAMAAQFLDGNPDAAAGLVLWAAFSAADVSDQAPEVALIYGSLDDGAARFTEPANLAKLGPNLTTTVIDGGNHEQMGWYTGQPNDPPATISREAQMAEQVGATVELLERLGG